ncbi:hypothetical protein [Arenibaculum sp.]|uniref:hypothetical protein n=1 Tax=Arenibaculum sp. TaxID=2865862 RepID=UPI002E11996D|nr:hypothetical protein [Arenibaculum sp.]
MADDRDEMPPPGPNDFYPDIRSAGPEEQRAESLGRIAAALEGLLAEIREIRAHLGAPRPGSGEAPPGPGGGEAPEWPPRG